MEQRAERLVRRARNGDTEAFTQLILRNEEMLSRVALSLLHNMEDAADAVEIQTRIEQTIQSMDCETFQHSHSVLLSGGCFPRQACSLPAGGNSDSGCGNTRLGRSFGRTGSVGHHEAGGQNAIGPVLPGQAFRSGDCESLGCQRKLRQTKAQPQPETVSRHIL